MLRQVQHGKIDAICIVVIVVTTLPHAFANNHNPLRSTSAPLDSGKTLRARRRGEVRPGYAPALIAVFDLHFPFLTRPSLPFSNSPTALSNTIPAAIVSALAHSSLAVSVGSQDGSGTGDYTVVSPYWYMGSAILYSFMGGYFAYVWIPDTYVLCGSKKFKTATKLATAWSMLCLLLGVVATLFAPDIRFQFVSILIGGALSTLTRLFVYCKRLGVPSDEDHSTRGCGRAVVHPLRAVGYILVAIAGLCGVRHAVVTGVI